MLALKSRSSFGNVVCKKQRVADLDLFERAAYSLLRQPESRPARGGQQRGLVKA